MLPNSWLSSDGTVLIIASVVCVGSVQFRQIIAEKIVRRGGTKLVEENSKIGVFLNRVLDSKCLLLSIAENCHLDKTS